MRIGYVRNQEVEEMEKQLNVILRKEIDEIVLDRTGDKLPGLLKRLKFGDVLHVAALDRFSRDIQTTVKILEDLYLKGVTLYVGGDHFKLSPTVSPQAKIIVAVRDALIAEHGEEFTDLSEEEQNKVVAFKLSEYLEKQRLEK